MISTVSDPGQYRINVITDGIVISAVTSIPEKIPVLSTDTGTTVIDQVHYYTVDINFTDKPGQKNYYMAGLRRASDYGNYYDIFASSSDMSVTGVYEDKLIFSDELFDGKNKSFSIEIEKSNLWSSNDSVDLEVDLYSLSYDMYMYFITLESQSYDSPFSEPVIVHSNINNGYGIFAGYSVFRYIIKVPAYNGSGWVEEKN